MLGTRLVGLARQMPIWTDPQQVSGMRLRIVRSVRTGSARRRNMLGADEVDQAPVTRSSSVRLNTQVSVAYAGEALGKAAIRLTISARTSAQACGPKARVLGPGQVEVAM